MSKVQSPNSKAEGMIAEQSLFVDGELLETTNDGETESEIEIKDEKRISFSKNKNQKSKTENQTSFLQYIVTPSVFLTISLLGGLRLDAENTAFVFLKPALICLVFAVILLVLFFRAHLIKLNGWFSEDFPMTKNIANAAVLLTLFFASTQIFNSLLPEKGLPFWTIAFCFFWTLWNNLFAEFDTKRLVQSLSGMFGLAFVVKYLFLANLTAPAGKSWIQGILENPTQQAFTWLLDLPKFAPATGYVQFFALIFYLIGLFLLKPETDGK